MTLEEAIIHCKEKACDNTQCALEHRQLAEWLKELQQYRKNAKQQEADLNNEIIIQWSKCNPTDEGMGSEYAVIGAEQFDAIVRHFYKLGRKQVLQEIYDGKTKPVDKITAAWFDDKGEESK